jgi:endonuclease/exonuclease/phosphatase family metal-dependent hydrolase
MAPGSKKLGIFSILILMVNIFFILTLAFSYLSVYISPEKSWILPFFGLLYPYLVLINIIFIIYWIIFRRWFFLLSAIIISAGWNHLQRTVQIRFSNPVPLEQAHFKVITYNVKNLSNDNVDLLEPEIRDNILSYLDKENAEIICLQEFAIVHPDPEAFLDSISARLSMPFHARSQYIEKPGKRMDAIFVFSKFPIINYGSFKKADDHNYALFADLVAGNDTFRLFNVHLESIRLKHEDYHFISELDLQFNENEDIKEGSRRIFNKLRIAFEKRAAQADILSASVSDSPYPVILCGDFNDTPNSYAYHRLAAGMKDAFLKSGRGFGNTYTGKLPSYRIDYILYSDHFTSWEYNRELVEFSDHYPISCLIGFKGEE